MVGRPFACCAVAGVVLGLAAAVTAGPPRGLDETSFQRLARSGPFSADVRGKATFRVPTGYRFVAEEKLPEFGELTGLPVLGDEAGYVMVSDRPTWLGVVMVAADDPLKGLDPKTLGEPAVRSKLLEWQQKFQDGRRPARGGPAATVGTWTHPPKYDEKTKVLTMGVRLESADGQKDKVNYQCFVYGPYETIACVSAVGDVEHYDKVEKETGKLAGEFTFLAPPADATTETIEDPMRMAKIAGGGIAGGVAVVLLFRFLGFGGTRPPARTPARRPPGARRS